MGILANLFAPKTTTDVTGPPPPVDGDYHGFEQENTPAPYISAAGLGGGLAGWAPNQRAYRTSGAMPGYKPGLDLEPPPDVAPAPFYRERNEQTLDREKVEHLHGKAWHVTTYENNERLSPWIDPGPPTNFRVTTTDSPSTWRFEVGESQESGPLGLRNQTHLNGNHFSGASNLRSYPQNGMLPARHFRNTFRAPPATIANPGLTDYSNAEGTLVQPRDTVVVSPSVVGPPRSFRLS